MYFLHFTNNPCAIIPLDPDHQPVLGAPGHLVEELQTLELPLGVEGAGLQQSRLCRLPSPGAEVHEVPSIWGGGVMDYMLLDDQDTQNGSCVPLQLHKIRFVFL